MIQTILQNGSLASCVTATDGPVCAVNIIVSITNPNPNIIRLTKNHNPNPNIRDSEEKIRIRIFVTTLPHSPARVHPRHADRQLLYQLQVARSVAVSGFSVTALTLIIRIPRDIERVCDDPL